MAKKTPEAKSTVNDLETYAEGIRKDLDVPRQNDVFRVAVEVGYLVALADGQIDDAERATLARAIETLSAGAVIEWETETLLDECEERAAGEGAEKRAEAAGKQLAELGFAPAGLLVAAVVAGASKGIDKKEADVLKSVGAAAGVTADAVRDIVKKATALSKRVAG
jgi:tellurite resistance protein